jgi:hypothetical protein
MSAIDQRATWKGTRLCLDNRTTEYSIETDERYPAMWRVRRPDGSLSDMANRTRAKDAAMVMLDRDLRRRESHSGGRL